MLPNNLEKAAKKEMMKSSPRKGRGVGKKKKQRVVKLEALAGIAIEEALGLPTNVYSSDWCKASVICTARLSCCFGQRLQTQPRASAHAGCPCCRGRWESCCLQPLKTQRLLFANRNTDMKADFLNLQTSFSTCVSTKKMILHLPKSHFFVSSSTLPTTISQAWAQIHCWCAVPLCKLLLGGCRVWSIPSKTGNSSRTASSY